MLTAADIRHPPPRDDLPAIIMCRSGRHRSEAAKEIACERLASRGIAALTDRLSRHGYWTHTCQKGTFQTASLVHTRSQRPMRGTRELCDVCFKGGEVDGMRTYTLNKSNRQFVASSGPGAN